MDNSEWSKLKEVFEGALELDEADRDAFLSGQDESVRSEVRELISSHLKAEGFIETPAAVEFGFHRQSLIGTSIGEYKLLEIIGSGGMGTVFRAQKEGFGKSYAVKLIKRGMDTDSILNRFRRERQLLAQLEHPGIARLLDGGTTADGLPYFVMEYVEGLTLNDYCQSNRLDVGARLELFQKICAAVTFAHQNLIVHRDLKPSNIIVAADGSPKLLDFGIAKLITAELSDETATHGRICTPEYASPEQIGGEPVTTASDVYSLGVILYELLSGKRPFTSDRRSADEVSRTVITGDPAKPSSVVSGRWNRRGAKATDEVGSATSDETPGSSSRTQPIDFRQIRGDLDNVVLKALRKEPERRYQSVQEFSEDIRRHLAGLPVSATADTAVYRISKFVRRHRRSVALAGLAVTIVSVLSGFAAWQGIVAARERSKAEKRLTEIRQVAKSLINETNDSLAKIPGNVAVQKALAEKSVAMLDSLAADETADDALLIELADSYTKLAKIQAWAFREFEKADENLVKAEVIYKKLIARWPADQSLRRKLYSNQLRRIESLHDTNRRDEMFGVGSETIENLRAINASDPENPTMSADLAAMYGWFGDKYTLFGRNEDAVASYRRGQLSIDAAIEKQMTIADTAKAKAELARLHFIKAWLLNGSGEKLGAIESYRAAGSAAELANEEDRNLEGNFERIIAAHEQIAGILESEDELDRALAEILIAKRISDEASRDPKMPDKSLLPDYQCFYTVYAGKIAVKLKRADAARRLFDESARICRQNIAQDADDEQNTFESLPFLYDIADYQAAVGDSSRAVRELKELAEKVRSTLEKNPRDLGAAFALAEIYEKMGDFAQNESSASYHRKSLDLWTEYSRENRLLPEESERMNRVAAKVAAPR
jgi:serine/threonine protein kinase